MGARHTAASVCRSRRFFYLDLAVITHVHAAKEQRDSQLFFTCTVSGSGPCAWQHRSLNESDPLSLSHHALIPARHPRALAASTPPHVGVLGCAVAVAVLAWRATGRKPTGELPNWTNLITHYTNKNTDIHPAHQCCRGALRPGSCRCRARTGHRTGPPQAGRNRGGAGGC